MQFDLTDVRMARVADATDRQRSCRPVFELERDRRQIFHVVIDTQVMEMRRGACEDASHARTRKHRDVGQRIAAFDAQFTHRLLADAAVGTSDMCSLERLEPVHGRFARLP